VPSVIVPEERNFVINVSHVALASVGMTRARRFAFDVRLFKG